MPGTAFSYSDNFDDGILNTSPWYYFARGTNLPTPNAVESNGYLQLNTTTTDNGANAVLVFLDEDSLAGGVSNATISMDRFYHASNSYFLGYTNFSFTTQSGAPLVFSLSMLKSAYAPDYGSNSANFNRPKLIISDSLGFTTQYAQNVNTSSFLDTWSTARISVDNTLGAIYFDLNSDGIREFSISDARLINASLQSIQFDGYGWFTGNYTRIDDLSITGTMPQNGPWTTADIFKKFGEMGFAAMLSNAAYNLRADENPGTKADPLNNAGGMRAFSISLALEGYVQFLDGSDLVPGGIAGLDPSTQFSPPGLVDGIYTNLNAAALVTRSADALFITFRGTNDNNGDYLWITGNKILDTPDGHHWAETNPFNGRREHLKLFDPLISALSTFLANDSSIKDIYVNGHSLGAAMVEGLVGNSSRTLHAITFASPGFPGGPLIDDGSITNLWIDGDPILGASFFTNNEGDYNTIYHNLPKSIAGDARYSLHDMDFYLDFVSFLHQQGIGLDQLNGAGLKGIDYDRLYAFATLNSTNTRISVGTGNDFINGSAKNDVILGGSGVDDLNGLAGRDYIMGGVGRDFLSGGDNGDFLFGGDQRDILYGGFGLDEMTGGLGNDVFFFSSNAEAQIATGGFDRVTDFATGDVIDLRGVDANILASGDQAFRFIGTAAYTGAGPASAGELRYASGSNGSRFAGDWDGDGISDMVVVLTGSVTMTSASFLL